MNEIFVGWGNILRHPKDKKSLVHLAWTIVVFLSLIQFWSSIYNLRLTIEWNLGYFLIVLVPVLLLHFLTMFLFPEHEKKSEIHLFEHFLKNKKTILFLFVSYIVIGSGLDIVLRENQIIAMENISTLLSILFLVGAGFIKNVWFHRVLVILFLLLFTLTLFQTKIS